MVVLSIFRFAVMAGLWFFLPVNATFIGSTLHFQAGQGEGEGRMTRKRHPQEFPGFKNQT
jgi:hypothetical protein